MLTHRKNAAILIAALALAGSALGACGSDDGGGSASGDDSATVEGVDIAGVWARTSPMAADAGAAYMELTSGSDDRLVSVSVDPSVAGTTEIHETVAADTSSTDASDSDGSEMGESDGMGTDDSSMTGDGDMPMDGAMTMRELTDGLELPAGETIALEPGGYHIMLLDLVEPLVEGDSFELTLSFETAGEVTVTVDVRSDGP